MTIDQTKRSNLREGHGDGDCCRLQKTWLFSWDEPGGSVVVTSAEEILSYMREDVLSEEFEDEERTVTIRPHLAMTQHELDELPEFGGW